MRRLAHPFRLALACTLLLLVWGCGGTTVTEVAGPTDVRCAVEVSPLEVPVGASRQTGSIAVSAERECAWSASSRAAWIAIPQATGQGDGRIEYVVSENPVPAERRGIIEIGGHAVQLVQEAAPCTFRLRPPNGSVHAEGGTVQVAVDSVPGCAWAAAAPEPWITVIDGSGDGSGTVTLQVAANTGPPREATLSIADELFRLSQAGACSFSLSPERSHVAAGGGGGVVAVGTAPWCEWTAVSQVPWIVLPNGVARTGPGTIALTVAANSGPPRSGGVTIAGQIHAVTQDAAPCVTHVEPLSQVVPLAGGTVTVAVSTQPWCEWSAVSHASWVQVTTGHQGAGPGTVTLTVARRPFPIRRTATLTIAGHTVTVQQP